MTDLADQLAAAIHATPSRFVLAITGGGASAIGTLLATPGGSRTLLEAVVPYSAAALDDFLGGPPEHYCTQATARAMAAAAFQRARHLAETPGGTGQRSRPVPSDDPEDPAANLAGVACTASLASDRPKRGPHRAHVAVQTADFTLAASLELVKGLRSRAEEEDLVARLVLQHVALACGISLRGDLAEAVGLPLDETERVVSRRVEAEPDWRDLLTGRLDAVCLGGEELEGPTEPPAELHVHGDVAGEEVAAAPSSGLIFPGSFNPRHAGHRGMADVAARRTGLTVEYELSIENVDKPPLDYFEIAERAAHFTPTEPLWLTRAATFIEKAALFPGATFIVGADTLIRIGAPRYYGDDEAQRDEALEFLAECGCRFLVFGRTDAEGRFLSLADLTLPPALAALCDEVPENEFREDVSATELRLAAQEPID